MATAKKVEIVIESIQSQKIITLLDQIGIEGYTAIKEATGRGTHGTHDAEGLTDVYRNSYIFVICAEKQAQQIVEHMQPILKKYGGICFISDVQTTDFS